MNGRKFEIRTDGEIGENPTRRISLAQVEEMIQAHVTAKIEEYVSKKIGTYTCTMNAEDRPLAPEVYKESMINFKYPNHLPSFQESGDSHDPQSFIFGFRV